MGVHRHRDRGRDRRGRRRVHTVSAASYATVCAAPLGMCVRGTPGSLAWSP
jgi:hypothetical protein